VNRLSAGLRAFPWAFALQPGFTAMETAWDRVEDTDVEREASSLIRLPLPPPEESDDGIDLDAPTLQRVPALAMVSAPAQVRAPLSQLFPPLLSGRAQLALALLATVAALLAFALALN